MAASVPPAPTSGSEAYSRRFTEFLFRNRVYLFATLISALALDVGYWGITNILNLRGVPLGIWVESTEIAADIGLTLGTVTLAMAGLLQSRAAGIQLWLAGKQADREDAQLKVARALTKPHLDFQVIETSEKPTTQETFVLLQDRWFIRALLRNLGPGVAVDVQVTAFNWVIGQQRLDEELANLAKGGSPRGPKLTNPDMIPTDIVNVPFALKSGEEREFGLQFRIPPSPEPMTGLFEQLVVIGWARDLEGVEAPAKRFGLRLQFAFPTSRVEAGDRSPRRTVWKWLTDEEIARISGLPLTRVSRRTGWFPPGEPSTRERETA
ncbi:MAG: hypothetical protein ACLQD9_01760 [Thermoplasmata archaeon]